MDSVPFSVVDCETTGLGPRDRIVELAIVTVDPCTGEVVDEFETIVNPGRDVGPVDIHGISAEMASMAPRFEEVAPVVAARLNHSTVVAHNLAFDLRMLGQEFARVNTSIDWGDGICTMRATGLSLGHAARAVGVRLSRHHRALNDARAAAAIVVDLGVRRNGAPCCIGSSKGQESCRTLRRDAFGVVIDVPIRRWARAACIPSSVEACVEYFDLLEHVLADLALSNAEAMELKSLRESIGLRDSQVRSMHEAYFESLRLAACSDGVVTARERELLQSVAHALGISRDEVPESNEKPPPGAGALSAGVRVCFTGSAVDADGHVMSRESLELIAAARGLQPVSAVTKKGCDLLVAADRATQSGKAKMARKYGIPIIEVGDFLRAIDSGPGWG
jgi:DNA polymerase-3 subunit epsilon